MARDPYIERAKPNISLKVKTPLDAAEVLFYLLQLHNFNSCT